MHRALRQHCIVLNLRLAEKRAVVGEDDHLCRAIAEALHSGLEAQRSLAGAHHELQARIDRLESLLGFLNSRSHFGFSG